MNAEQFFNNGFGADVEKVHRKHVIELMTNFAKHYHTEQCNIPHVSGSLPSEEEIREPMQNALYATGNFLTDECAELATGILEYLQDAGYKVVRQ